ncbi:MAG: histidine--tRNA ligase [Myxococcota bacterium]
MKLRALQGFRDFYPEDLATRRWIESAWHRASRRAGFEEWDGPPLESLDLYTAKSGDEIVRQLYAFEDKGGRSVALRPEMTPTLARMIGARAGGMRKPIKWYCVPQFFRYERPQRGRLREFYQWNVDVIGASDPAADAEVIGVALDALALLGLGDDDVRVRVSDRRSLHRLLRELEVDDEAQAPVLAALDKLERDPSAGEGLVSLLGASASRQLLDWCQRTPLDRAPEIEALLAACADYGLTDRVRPDLRIVRGLDYYTGPVWEIFAAGRDLRAIAGGGRYDELIASLGGPALPALGFGMGDVVLHDLLREKSLIPDPPARIEVIVVPIGAAMCGPARRVVRQLRSRGVAAEAPYDAPKLLKALRAAEQAGARRAVIVGPDEWESGSVVVRDLEARRDRTVKLEDLE